MSARRQSSTTSLAKYARTTEQDIRSLDFCNAFWGPGDGGVDVLFARMRGAARTMEELRTFWKERSSIEEDYAKRLAKLAKMPIGKDEIGELRNSIDTLRLETDKQAGFHSQLAQQIRTDLEGQVGAFVSKQQHHKKVYQTAIEKEFKVKQTREQHASKAREKYESDCLRINSYTAQSTLVQGKDLEKIHLKLERAQQTVQVNENDYAQFTRVLQETMQKWEQDWKAFCDVCQDLEEERMEFMKDNMWAYANAVSTVCVSDDESCEKMRLALEQLEPEKDMENFVRDYGTGNQIPESPLFVNYANTDAPPVSASRLATRPASFARSTQRAKSAATLPPDDEPYDDMNRAGVGAGGSGGPSRSPPVDGSALSRSGTQKSVAPSVQTNGVNGHTSPVKELQRRQSTASPLAKPASTGGDPVDPTVAATQLVIGDRAWDVDPSKDPQVQKAAPVRNSPPAEDPLVKQMAELSTAAAASPLVRRNTLARRDPPPVGPGKGAGEALATPGTANTTMVARDFKHSAEGVVGSYPLAQTPSRSASPNPPKAALVAPPPPSVSQATAGIPVERIVGDYQRPFPGEPRSRANSFVGAPPPGAAATNQTAGQMVPRPTSRDGYAGIGAQALVARAPSPARGPSPTEPSRFPRFTQSGSTASNNAANRRESLSFRPVTPNNNPVGITLGPDGRVVHDVMVQPARQPPSHYPQVGPPPPVQPAQPPQAYPGYHDPNRGALTRPQQAPQQAPPQRADYTVMAPPANYATGPQYTTPQHPGYSDGYHTQQYAQAPPPPQPNYGNYAGARPAYQQHQPTQSVGYPATTRPSNNALYRPASPGMVQGRSPSPAAPRGQQPPPTGTYTDDGRPILFYVKALYDYSATIDEEFDFQAGDIIAVTDTPEDGWWSGELLDDTRRQAGRHVFPSNFVCLF